MVNYLIFLCLIKCGQAVGLTNEGRMKQINFIAKSILYGCGMGLVSVYAGAGDSHNGYPNNQERAVHTFTNAVRMSPEEYRNKYLGVSDILLPATYPAVNPIYLNYTLSQTAREHSIDMGDNCGLQHNSCDGSTFLERLTAAYSKSGVGENIAMGQKSGFLAVKAWLLDNINGVPALDGSGDDGHRKNIMNSKFMEMGSGSYQGMATGKLRDYWTQDFGSKAATTYPIASGAFDEIVTGTYTFLANYFDASGKAPQSSEIILDGVATHLTLELGSAAKGTYTLNVPKGDGCMNYYFEFTDGDGAQWRYPENMTLSTVEGTVCENSTSNKIWRTEDRLIRTPEQSRFDLLGRPAL